MPSKSHAKIDQKISLTITSFFEVYSKDKNTLFETFSTFRLNLGRIKSNNRQICKTNHLNIVGKSNNMKISIAEMSKPDPPTPNNVDESTLKYKSAKPRANNNISISNSRSTTIVVNDVVTEMFNLSVNPNALIISPTRNGKTLLAATLDINGPAHCFQEMRLLSFNSIILHR